MSLMLRESPDEKIDRLVEERFPTCIGGSHTDTEARDEYRAGLEEGYRLAKLDND